MTPTKVNGFLLLELVVALFIFTVSVGVLARMLMDVVATQQTVERHLAAVNAMRDAAEDTRLTRQRTHGGYRVQCTRIKNMNAHEISLKMPSSSGQEHLMVWRVPMYE